MHAPALIRCGDSAAMFLISTRRLYFPSPWQPPRKNPASALCADISLKNSTGLSSTAAALNPHDTHLAFKGAYLLAETLTTLRHSGASLYNHYPDTSAFFSLCNGSRFHFPSMIACLTPSYSGTLTPLYWPIC